MPANPIVLMTDFGESDPYVGIMKGVISTIVPDPRLIDLSHQIPPGDIQAGAFHLWQAASYFPPRAVFLAVVDPGVGTNRKALFFQRGTQVFIGPDNGLFSYLGYRESTSAWELSNPDFQLRHPSHTFHGRDIFAPAAAHAALGAPGEHFGEPVSNPRQLPQPICQINKDQMVGEVISIDRFGNLITSLGKFQRKSQDLEFSSWIEDRCRSYSSNPRITIDQTSPSLPMASTFNDIPAGKCAGVIGSSGLLEIAARGTSAADLLGLERGARITLSWN